MLSPVQDSSAIFAVAEGVIWSPTSARLCGVCPAGINPVCYWASSRLYGYGRLRTVTPLVIAAQYPSDEPFGYFSQLSLSQLQPERLRILFISLSVNSFNLIRCHLHAQMRKSISQPPPKSSDSPSTTSLPDTAHTRARTHMSIPTVLFSQAMYIIHTLTHTYTHLHTLTHTHTHIAHSP
jgi:hypothetical protein